jgi:hypothetical protein
MFIFNRRIWGPLAGVATALLIVFALGMQTDRPAQAPAANAQVASAAFGITH